MTNSMAEIRTATTKVVARDASAPDYEEKEINTQYQIYFL